MSQSEQIMLSDQQSVVLKVLGTFGPSTVKEIVRDAQVYGTSITQQDTLDVVRDLCRNHGLVDAHGMRWAGSSAPVEEEWQATERGRRVIAGLNDVKTQARERTWKEQPLTDREKTLISIVHEQYREMIADAIITSSRTIGGLRNAADLLTTPSPFTEV